MESSVSMKFFLISLFLLSSCKSTTNRSASELSGIREEKLNKYDDEFKKADIEISGNKTDREKIYLLMERVNRLAVAKDPSLGRRNRFIEILSDLKVVEKSPKNLQQRLLVASAEDPSLKIERDPEVRSYIKKYDYVVTVGVAETPGSKHDELEVLNRQVTFANKMLSAGLYSTQLQESAALFTTIERKYFDLLASELWRVPSALKKTKIGSMVLSFRSHILELGTAESKARIFVVNITNDESDENLSDFLNFVRNNSLDGIPIVDKTSY